MPPSLRELFRNLHDEDMAARAECELSFSPDNYDICELKSILDDDSCDHPDSEATWVTTSPYSRAKSANLKLAEKTVTLLHSYIVSEYERLLHRKSAAFRKSILEYLLLHKCQPLTQFVKMAIAEPDLHKRWMYLWNFMTGLNRASLTNETRSELFDLLEPLSHETQDIHGRVDFPRLLATLCPERAREYFASSKALYATNPSLDGVLFQASELNARISSPRLYALVEELSKADGLTSNEREERLLHILNAAVCQQSHDFESLFMKGLEHKSKRIRGISQKGLIHLRMPHNPVRMSVELVQSSNLKHLSREIKVVGFAAKYASVFDANSPLEFAEESTPSEYRNTMKAIGVLDVSQHLNFLSSLLATVNDDYDEFKRLRGSTRRKFEKQFESLAKQLDFGDLHFAINAFIISHPSAFEKRPSQD
jgi:hypothetical protein